MRIYTLLTLSALSIAAAAPAFAHEKMAAHDPMTSGSMMKMSKADARKMKACHAMSHDKMMTNVSCKKMMKMHPDMMKHDAMMKPRL